MKKVLLSILLTIPTFSSLLRPGFYPMHDDMQAMRLLQMDKCFKDGQIPCRWVPDMGFGYGYPQFNYYAPLPYYVMELVHLTGVSILVSVKVGFILSLLWGVIGMYLLGKSVFGEYAGILSAIFYAYLPYRAVNMYVRGAMGELWGMAFLPFVFWSSYNLVKDDKYSLLWFALSFSALLTSHNIIAFAAIPLLIIWFVVLLFYEKKTLFPRLRLKLLNIFTGFLWATGLSAFFILPAWFERNLVHIETLTGGYFSYFNHFVGLKQLLFSNYWGYGTSEYGPYDEMYLSIGLWYWLLPLVMLTTYLFLKKRSKLPLLLCLIGLGWMALFLIHPKSIFIWDRIYLLSLFQFPWRFLAIAGFLFSLSIGAFAGLLKSVKTFTITLLIPFSAILLIFYSTFFRPSEWLDITDAEKFSGDEWQRQQTVSIYDYLPIYAKKAPDFPAPGTPEILFGKAEIISGEKGTNWAKWDVVVYTKNAEVQLPFYYFPNFNLRIDGNPAPFNYDNEHGLISLDIKQGKHIIRLELEDTPIRTFSNLLSLGSLVAIPAYLRKRKLQ